MTNLNWSIFLIRYFGAILIIFEQTDSSDTGCYIPKRDFLIVKDQFTNITLNPETYVQSATFIGYYCSKGSFLDGIHLTNFCDEENWLNPHPKCIKMCPPIVGHTIKVNCNFKGKGISCDEYVEPGTTAKITCAVMYELPQNTLVHEDLICQLDGNWDYSAFTCEQTCGTIETKTAFSLKSQITKIHKVPWHTAIYWKNETGKFEQLCGGTIIYPNVIISAAHCFWNTQTSSLNNESDYIVAAGKFYRDFYAKNEPENVQIRTIQQINTAIQFSGSDYDYLGDIAVLLLHDHIEFKSHIRPACVTWKNYNDRFISSNVPGIVAGWGITESGANSEELRSVELLSLDGESCKLRVSKFNKISNDKFCVETSEGKNVCSGDSGGGFLVPVPINGTIYYHLWGIVSNGFKNQNDNVHICNSKFTTNFVNIQYYKDLVTQSVKNFSLVTHNNSGCLIPTKRYLILTDSQSETILEPGTYIKSLTSVKYACKENALLEGESHTNLCDGNWVQPHPKCIKLCPPIKAFNMNVLCYKKRIGVSCNKPVQPGTVAKISCAFMYKNLQFPNLNDELHCEKDGIWSYSKFKCEQVCGTIDSTIPFNSEIIKTEVHNVPWQANIYYKNEKGKYQHICSGTLINSRVVITAASCFWKHIRSGSFMNYVVTIGNLYLDYYAENETEIIQKFNISKILYNSNFTKVGEFFANDIATIILNDNIIYKNHIRPACLSWRKFMDKQILNDVQGKIIGNKNKTIISTMLSTIHYELCTKILNKSYSIMKNKFCAQQNIENKIYSVLQGSGFVVPEFIDGAVYFHLWGISSNIKSIINKNLKLKNPTTIFTNVQMYKSLITKSANYAQKQLNSTIDLGCHIPRIRHVLFLENSTNSVLIAGTYVPSLTTITYACPKGLFFDGDHSTNTCYGDWINSHPECTEICPPVAHDHTVKLNCNYKRKKISCDKPFRPGTIIKISCAFMYQKPLNVHVHDKIQCQSDGDWDHSVFKCKQICGIFDKELSNEKNQLANIYRAPWHIAMYHTTYDKTMYKFICAGTLVKSRVVMSVAHCFWPDIRLEVFDKGIYSEYKIVAGKLFQDYYSNKDKGLIQETEIMDVTIPVQYEGQTYDYVSDIAIILLKDHIIFTNHIRPACLLWQPYEKKNLPENKEGRIAGWALLNFDEMDKGIRSIQYISVNECKNYTTVYKVSSDKFCTKLGKENNICSSGTGLLIPEDINGTTLYNLWGILSLDVTGSPRDKCSNSVVAFSNVQWYESLIETIINEKFNL